MPFLYGSKAHDSSEPPLSIVKEQPPLPLSWKQQEAGYLKSFNMIEERCCFVNHSTDGKFYQLSQIHSKYSIENEGFITKAIFLHISVPSIFFRIASIKSVISSFLSLLISIGI